MSVSAGNEPEDSDGPGCDQCEDGFVPCEDCGGVGTGGDLVTTYEDGEEKQVYGNCESCKGTKVQACDLCNPDGTPNED